MNEIERLVLEKQRLKKENDELRGKLRIWNKKRDFKIKLKLEKEKMIKTYHWNRDVWFFIRDVWCSIRNHVDWSYPLTDENNRKFKHNMGICRDNLKKIMDYTSNTSPTWNTWNYKLKLKDVKGGYKDE